MVRYVSGDIGGTNSRLQLWQSGSHITDKLLPTSKSENKTTCDTPLLHSTGTDQLIAEQSYASQHFASLTIILQKFLAQHNRQTHDKTQHAEPPLCCCLAVAGPVQDNVARITNVKWIVSGAELSRELRIPYFSCINDFQGVGYGLLALSPKDLIVVNEHTSVENLDASRPTKVEHRNQPIGVCGSGTGLGQCYLTWNGSASRNISEDQSPQGEYVCHSSEGGHTDFAARNALEWQLLCDLKMREPSIKRVSNERFISGLGLPHIYKTLAALKPQLVNAQVALRISRAEDASRAISEAANKDECACCTEVMNVFMQLYGAECGNLALKLLPRGGLYIAGGIASKNMRAMFRNQQFYRAYKDKGRMSPLLRDTPIYLVNHPSVGLLGAQVIAKRMLDKHRLSLVKQVASSAQQSVSSAVHRIQSAAHSIQSKL